MWLFWLLSQAWIAIHIWTPKCERLASTERLFVTPMYSSLLIDQSLALNRKREDDYEVRADEVEQDPTETDYEEIRSIDSSHKEKEVKHKADTIPRIYACATMWHETKVSYENVNCTTIEFRIYNSFLVNSIIGRDDGDVEKYFPNG